MGKIKTIQKSRKECKCGKCGNIIPVGSSYLRGTLNFHPDIIRCTTCGLQHWEVTTSDYVLSVGEIVNRWSENYGTDESTPEAISSELDSIRDDLQGRYDNMPENLQYSETGELLQNRIDGLESAIQYLEAIDVDSLKESVLNDFNSQCLDGEEVEELDWENPDKYEDFNISEALEQYLTDAIEEALSDIEY